MLRGGHDESFVFFRVWLCNALKWPISAEEASSEARAKGSGDFRVLDGSCSFLWWSVIESCFHVAVLRYRFGASLVGV